MVKIRIYVEGGGEGKNTKATFRQGMSQFLQNLTGQKVDCIVCGTRNNAHRSFKNALKSNSDAIHLLLVDSEDFVRVSSPKQHLIERDNWDLSDIDEENIHLMVQVMESWLIVDIEALANFYGQKFNRNAIPQPNNIEQIAKPDVESALKNATKFTQKGEYHKINHGPKILATLDVSIVRNKSAYCDRLYQYLLMRSPLSR
jgi:hypothetical protein